VVMGADFYESGEEIARNRDRGVPDVGIGRDCEIREAIVDKNARIGHGVRLVNRNGAAAESADNYVIVDGLIVVPKDAVIPDGSVI
jgi:glucose-1-phosphate adenylyltransferase